MPAHASHPEVIIRARAPNTNVCWLLGASVAALFVPVALFPVHGILGGASGRVGSAHEPKSRLLLPLSQASGPTARGHGRDQCQGQKLGREQGRRPSLRPAQELPHAVLDGCVLRDRVYGAGVAPRCRVRGHAAACPERMPWPVIHDVLVCRRRLRRDDYEIFLAAVVNFVCVCQEQSNR